MTIIITIAKPDHAHAIQGRSRPTCTACNRCRCMYMADPCGHEHEHKPGEACDHDHKHHAHHRMGIIITITTRPTTITAGRRGGMW